MKNIFVIPTEQISKLYKIKNKLYFEEYPDKDVVSGNQNIYITSDEEIKDFWVLNTHTNEVYFLKGFYGIQSITKKIILTTDPKLIADGVQSIDDNFLQWFVNNLSCEEVEVGDWYNKFLSCCRSKEECHCNKKRIIIPKEECCKDVEGFNLGMICPKCNKPFRSVIEEPNYNMKQEILDEIKRLKEDPKQTSIEEAANRYFPLAEKIGGETYTAYRGFIEGVQSDAARDYWFNEFKKSHYSEEYLEVAYFEGRENNLSFIEWFENFKQQ